MEEPTTPAPRAVFIVRRIESAMRDFAALHPLSSRNGQRVHASPRWLSPAVPAHYTPVAVCDWSAAGPRQSSAGQRLGCAMALYVEGKVSLALVKRYYQAFAAAHLVWWVGGRMFYTEAAARLCVVEDLNERMRVAQAAVDTEAAPPANRPRLAYSRREGLLK